MELFRVNLMMPIILDTNLLIENHFRLIKILYNLPEFKFQRFVEFLQFEKCKCIIKTRSLLQNITRFRRYYRG
jgi:hypothetical protein